MVDAQPDLAPLIRRVRGGYLKIQGTWMPYEVCLSAFALSQDPHLYPALGGTTVGKKASPGIF